MKVDQCNKKRLFCCVSSFFRRILSLLLMLALVPMSLAMPAMADEVNSSDQFINVFDYGGINQTTNNGVTLADGSWFYYHIPSGRVRYIDIIFTSTSDVVSGYVSRYGVDSGSNWLSTTLYELDNNTYRLVSNGYEYGWDNIYVMLDFVDASSRIEVLAFNISYSSFTYQPIEVTGTGVALGLPSINLSTSFPDSPYSNWTYDSFEQYQGYQTDGIFRYSYYISEWNKFDYIDLQLGFIVGSITSISAYIGDQNVPLSVNYLNNSGASANSAGQYYIYITSDLTGFNHSLSDPLVVVVNGAGKFQLTNQANIFDACGKICLDNLSPLSYWFVSLESWIVNLRSTLSKKFDDLGTNIGTSITSLATNIESWISAQTSSLNIALGSLRQSLIDGFEDVISDLGTLLAAQASRIMGGISDGVDAIVDAITGGDNADDLQQGADQIGEAGSSLGSNIGSIHDFEDQYFGQLDSNMGSIISAGNISGIVAPLAFVQRYTNMIVAGIPSNFMVIFTLPILLGIFMFMVNHRIKVPRPDRSGDNVTHEVGGRNNDSVG